MASASDLILKADNATASGDLKHALALLEQAVAIEPDDIASLVKLAGLQRALGDPADALGTVHRALKLNPLDFTALLLRASLLERLGRLEAVHAWSQALAQRPGGELPQQLVPVVAHAEGRVAKWVDGRELGMRESMKAAEKRATAEERQRLERFRTNVLRRTSHYHSQPTHFHYPGLPEIEFYPRRLFPWLGKLEAATEVIAAEFSGLAASQRPDIQPYVQYEEFMPLNQWRTLNKNLDWSAIHLLRNGAKVEANARHCPRTLDFLAGCDQPRVPGASPNAMFSLLAPHTQIPAHVGVNNARLVCHLPLVVPDKCWFRVGAETRYWRRGEAFVFDDTIEHEAMNPSDQLRVVLIFDVWQPMLSDAERDGISALIESEGGMPGEAL